jgi:hypothetical protein
MVRLAESRRYAPPPPNTPDMDAPLVFYRDYYSLANNTLNDPASVADYTYRWRSNTTGSNSGGWKGFFAKNLQLHNTKIANTVNNGDCVLDDPWYFNQIFQEPDRGSVTAVTDLNFAFANLQAGSNPFPLGRSNDNLLNQAWIGQFEWFSSQPQIYGGDPSILRRWNRLATWYPSRSGPVGAFAYAGVLNSSNFTDIDFTKIVQNQMACSNVATFPAGVTGVSTLKSELANRLDTHAYMTDQLLPQVWHGYKLLQHRLYPDTYTDPQ